MKTKHWSDEAAEEQVCVDCEGYNMRYECQDYCDLFRESKNAILAEAAESDKVDAHLEEEGY